MNRRAFFRAVVVAPVVVATIPEAAKAKPVQHLTFHVQAWDGQDVKQVFKEAIIPLLKKALLRP